MNRFCLPLIFCFLAWWTADAGPREEFAGVVNAIRQADQMLEAGRDHEAMKEYRKAQEALLDFRKIYPHWDDQVVAFRLRYLSDRLAKWSDPGSNESHPSDAEVEGLRSRIEFLERSTRQYQAQVSQLISENSRLSSRLREALAVRPAVEDPAVVAATRSKLEIAEKESARLKSRVEELESELASIPKADEARRNQTLLEEARKNLNAALAEVKTLRRENDSLHKMVDNPPPKQTADAGPEGKQHLMEVRQRAFEMELQRLQSENEELRRRLAGAGNKGLEEATTGTGIDALPIVDQARLALASGRNERAIQLLTEELDSHKNNVEAWYLMGRARRAANNFAEAQAALNQALKLAPNLGAAHLELARLLLRSVPSDPSLARWHYYKAIGLGMPRDESLEGDLGWEPSPAQR